MKNTFNNEAVLVGLGALKTEMYRAEKADTPQQTT